MKISFECDDPEVCKLILKGLLEHIESKAMCEQLELSIEMAKKIRQPLHEQACLCNICYAKRKEKQDPHDIWADQ